MSQSLSAAQNIHILGIGGIGISALARLCLEEEKEVSGQDTASSPVIVELKKAGVKIFIGQSIARIPKGTDLIVYSEALEQRAPEFLERVRKLSIPMLSYPQALGELSKQKKTVAIAGTHGKTTTTAMVAHALLDAELDPTVVVGSILKDQNSNFIFGRGEHLVVEADEYKRAFLHLTPFILVITNIGLDHLDYYKDFADIQSAFAELAARVPKNGYVVLDRSDKKLQEVIRRTKAKIIDYGEFRDANLRLPFPGAHNKENAAAAAAAAHVLGVPKKRVLDSLTNFGGTWRRFDYRGKTAHGVLVYDDYAHNPDKIRAAISGYRERFPKQRLAVVFQPHLYSRTKTLFEGFTTAFSGADIVLVTPIFAAREKKDKEISSALLAKRIQKEMKGRTVLFIPQLPKVRTYIERNLKQGDVLITMGAGDIYELADSLVAAAQKKRHG
ncbi:MAG: hypothetical protein A2664_00935 [Candidatus Taylorbacteria bacterium RIFCSPHIGHO2_01_FULL_46_22b]|uniref:UDP-N-acetylmuramate--L-alanine ligase n=1 Tax=Candidatus Taylorbacteria bacterium RIFCSPHIGHO2_01_FULL_46_22b TaxID=1802301 RepID=A0A1G2M407_9BACT|nr:MAG: hypothetical protein A2664_00935 [Candidatus Taylorbacteria bacterium RIFCSPHIGHO2_01_FULL_46_22b]